MGEWIEHTGNGLPVAVGTMVFAEDKSGAVHGPFRAGCTYTSGRPILFGAPANVDWEVSCWHWAIPGNIARMKNHIIRYRLSDTDDKAKREARIELFRGIAKSKEFLIEETLKPREKVK